MKTALLLSGIENNKCFISVLPINFFKPHLESLPISQEEDLGHIRGTGLRCAGTLSNMMANVTKSWVLTPSQVETVSIPPAEADWKMTKGQY